jgi:putative membrane protein
MLLGFALGTFTGLVPGVHPNTVFLILVAAGTGMTAGVPAELVLVFIISVAVSNTFTDFLPSVIFGAPDPATALSVLPGHKMLLQGRGHEAIVLTVIGGVGVCLLTLLTFPLIIFVIPWAYLSVRPYLHIILILVVSWMVLTETGWRRPLSLLVFFLSGGLGLVALNSFPSDSLLFPSLTGMFALSMMLVSYRTETSVPPQEFPDSVNGDHRKGILTGWLAGWFAGMLPGVGAAQAGVIAAQAFRARTGEFLTALGGINTSNILFTLIVFFLMGKTRSGAAWAISQFSGNVGVWLAFTVFVAGVTVCLMSAAMTTLLSRTLLSRIGSFSYSKMTLFVMSFLLVMVWLLSGFPGLLATASGTFIGLLAISLGVRRSHMMGFLLVPTILYFSGLSPSVMVTLGL